MGRGIRAALVAALLATGTQVLGAAPQAVAAPVSCAGSAKIFENRSGTLYYYEHHTPATGTVSWTQGRAVGVGFDGDTVAGPGGLVYYVNSAGELRRYRFDGTRWTENGTLLGTGWKAPQGSPFGRPYLSVDSAGRIFAVDWTRTLRVFDASVPTWDLDKGRPLDVGWSGRPVTAGDNVFYKLSGGELFRYRYDPDSQRLTGHVRAVGSGIGVSDELFSPGGDVLYRVEGTTGNLYWYRYDADTATWANNGAGRLVGNNWSTQLTVRSDTCTTASPGPVGNVTPEPPDPARAFQGAGEEGAFTWTYLTAPGRVQQLYGPADGTPSPVGTQELASDVTTASNADTMSLAGIDATGQAWLSTSDQALGSWTKFGRGLTKIRFADPGRGVAQAVATDADGNLWWRQKLGQWTAWRQVFAGAPFRGFDDVAIGGTGALYGITDDGWWFTIDQNSQFGPEFRQGRLPSTADFDQPTVVDFSQVPVLVARHKADGVPYMLIGGGPGFANSAWQPLPAPAEGVTLAEKPLAADEWMWGRIALAAEGSDGYVYATTWSASTGATLPWQRVGEPAANDVALTDGGGMGMHLGYRGRDGKVHHYVDARVPAPTGPLVFTGGAY